MRYLFSFLLCVMFGLSFYSCQRDESGDEPGPVEIDADPTGFLIDGGEISDVGFYCLENNQPVLGEMSYYDYCWMTKTVGSYSDFYLQLKFNRNAPFYQTDDADEMVAIGKIEGDYEKSKSLFIVEEYEKYRHNNQRDEQWPNLFTAYTNGEVSITCDKVLFGEEPGTNLEKYFNVNKGLTDLDSRCLPVGIENPRMLYNFGEEIPSDMDKFFVKGTWLQPQYYLQFKELPTEKYDELTLSVTFPMIREHVRDYAVAKYRGETVTSPKLTEDVFKADCPIKFEWE